MSKVFDLLAKYKSDIQEKDAFIEAIYEIAYGDNAINREFTRTDILAELTKYSMLALQTADLEERLEIAEKHIHGEHWEFYQDELMDDDE